MDGSTPQHELRLTCKPARAGGRLVFPYVLENLGSGDLFVMDALTTIDPATGTWAADERCVVVIERKPGEAVVGKFPAPGLAGRPARPRPAPLARRLGPGETLQSELTIMLPLAEASPHLPELRLRQYEVVALAAVTVAIGFWPAATRGLYATPAEHAPDRLALVARDLTGCGKLAWQRFPTKDLLLFRRTDAFPRSV